MASTTSAGSTNSNLYNLYVTSCIDLAKTVVVKLDQIAQAMNYLVMQKSGTLVDSDDRTTWKYYQNISGTYNFTDTAMVVESLDTETQISFDALTLQSHPTTVSAYAYGSYYYNELVTKYPDQEMLIRGILYPCDMATAIEAAEGTILSYPPKLVEDAETEFIAQLQTWVQGFLGRWVIPAFSRTDNLYIATYFAQLVLNMIPAIMNIRLRACKTNQAHSFHLGQYLKSHGFLDSYLAELTQEQTLDFYRNINYYVRHAGSQATFEQLVELLMTKRGLPLYEYEFRHNVETIHYVSLSDTSSISPTALFKRKPLNSVAQSLPVTDFNLTDVLSMMASAAPGNEAYQAAHATEMEESLDRSPKAVLKTKVIESALAATTNAQVSAPDSLIYNHWLALATDGTYQAPFQFTPQGTSIPIELNQQQAVALWVYALAKGLEPDNPPTGFQAITRVPRIGSVWTAKKTPPTFTQLRALTTSVVSDALITQAVSLATPVPTTITSITAFSTFCSEVYQSTLEQALLTAFQEDQDVRGQMEFVTKAFYHPRTIGDMASLTVTPSPSYVGLDYITFLSSIGFTPSNYSKLDYYNLTTQLFEAATGADQNKASDPVNIQAAMMSLLKDLSSYSIQIVSSSNQSDVTEITRSEVRFNHFNQNESTYDYVQAARCDVELGALTEVQTAILDWNDLFPVPAPLIAERDYATVELDDGLNYTVEFDNTVRYSPNIAFTLTSDFDAQATFNALPLATRRQLWANNY